MPRRADLDPVDIPRLLPHVMLVEVQPEGRYRYRLIGTANAQEHGVNATGRYVDEVLQVRERRSIYSESLFLSDVGGVVERHTKVLFMPLSEDGATVRQVFVAQVFRHVDQNTRDKHFVLARPYKEIAHVRL